jgi:hypothetical protein
MRTMATFFKLDGDDLAFQVTLWNDAKDIPERVLAAAVGISIACAAYEETLVHYRPDRHRVILRQGARVIRDSRPR